MTHRFRSIVSLALFAGFAGCTDDPPKAAPSNPGLSNPSTCPAGQVCLNVTPVTSAAIPNGRLIVAFYQLNDDIQPAPEAHVAYDVPFVGTSTSVQIALADLQLPTAIDDYRVCLRTCEDLANPACDCPAAEAKLATGLVAVMVDTDGSGGIDPSEFVAENLYGVGVMHFGESDAAYPAANELEFLLPEGIRSGLSPYRIIDGERFDQLGLPATDAVYDLDVCVPADESCESLRFPNLT